MVCLMVNAIYEVLQRAYGLNVETYRLILLRYVYIIAYGCFLFIGKRLIKKSEYICLFLIGTTFLILYHYKGYEPRIIIYWTKTCFLACFYIVPIANVLIRLKIHNRILEVIGKASYNIFLTQMVYYEFMARSMYEFVPSRIIQLIININICVIVGVVFYYLESPVTKTIVNRGIISRNP